ncbi:hypothetical protein Salmi_Mp115 (mitochondrion) [Salvia miltiorrhiza]|uniref:Uncharacterized protein n=1 Tax=Salvia miltiorrhiza TaxID=226208 RepID=V9P5E1_SALMI|nr:hypothetical protein Salmi_Mp115 [Salvia miltiorrhiza]AGU16643.1 hypothetical protein Salmi_Mp115 [Salvia miltiorrhiza]
MPKWVRRKRKTRKGNPISVRNENSIIFFLMKFYFSFTNAYFFLLLGGSYSIFTSLPLVRDMPKESQIILYILTRFLFLFVIYKQLVDLGYAFMNELQQAVAPFLQPSGGIGGSSGQPPLPSDPFIPLVAPAPDDPEENPPGQPLFHQQQNDPAVGQQKLESVLVKHLKRHCRLVDVRKKYPQLNSTEVDSLYFAKNLAISQLDTDTKTDSEMEALADYLTKNAKKRKTLLDDFLAEYSKED